MGKQSKGRSRPMPDAGAIKIISKLQQALNNESDFICDHAERKPWEVTMSARDGAVCEMRFLRIWFDLPPTVFFTAVNYLDMFLARMKVQEKFLSCLSVSCLNIAATCHGYEINSSQLVTLSQSKCSVKDMERMSSIITQKLNTGKTNYLNTMDLLQRYIDIFSYIAVKFKIEGLLNRILQWEELCTRLEMLLCDSTAARYKPSVLALAFVHVEMDRFLSREVPKKSNYYTVEMFYVLAVMIEVQYLCNIDTSEYESCFEAVTKILKEYDGRKRKCHRQKLTWRFSVSTHALSGYTHHYSMLNTVKEE